MAHSIKFNGHKYDADVALRQTGRDLGGHPIDCSCWFLYGRLSCVCAMTSTIKASIRRGTAAQPLTYAGWWCAGIPISSVLYMFARFTAHPLSPGSVYVPVVRKSRASRTHPVCTRGFTLSRVVCVLASWHRSTLMLTHTHTPGHKPVLGQTFTHTCAVFFLEIIVNCARTYMCVCT